MWWWIVAVLIVIFIIWVMFTDIHIRVWLLRNSDESKAEIDIKALHGLIRFPVRVPRMKVKPGLQGVHLDLNTPLIKQPSELDISRSEFREYRSMMQQLIANMRNYREWLEGTLQHVRIYRLKWETEFGLGFAAETGMASGILWALKGTVLRILSRWTTLKVLPTLRVTPFYDKTAFHANVELIGRIRVYRLVIVGVMLMFRVLRKPGGIKTWSRVVWELLRKRQRASTAS